MAAPLKRRVEKSDYDSNSAEEEETREIRFFASFAIRIAIPENYVAVMASMPTYHPTHLYRLSYKLFPMEDTTDIDVALFGSMAKLYCKDQTMCLKVYEDRRNVWIAWSKQHILKVTDDDVLLSTFNHVCNVFVLNAPEKLKFDRPKGFRVTDAFYESIQFLRTYSQWSLSSPSTPQIELSHALLPELPPDAWEKLSRMSVKSVDINDVPPWQEIEEIRLSFSMPANGNESLDSPDYSFESANPSTEVLRTLVMCGLQPLAGINYKLLREWIIEKRSSIFESEYFHVMDDLPTRSLPISSTPDKYSRSPKARKGSSNTEVKEVRKRLTQMTPSPILQLKMQAFISGMTSQVVRLDKSHNPTTLSDVVFLVSCEEELLSARQRTTLNPLSVKIWHVEDLPPIEKDEEVEQSAKTVYAKYKILNFKDRRTKLKHHNAERVVWNDSHVFLLGTMTDTKIREFFSGPPLLIEVHDRDSGVTLQNMKSSKPTLFGGDPLDSAVSSPDLTSYNKITDSKLDLNHPLHMFGVAQLDLSGFLVGKTKLEFCEQIMCSSKQKLRQKCAQKYVRETFNPTDIYLEAGTSLEVTCSLRVPLHNPTVDPKLPKGLVPQAYFARIIIKLSSTQQTFLYKLMKTIIDINTEEFSKNDLPLIYCVGLSIPLLSMLDHVRQEIDVITGVHIFNNDFHLFYLEGHALGNMQYLWKHLSCLDPGNYSQRKILYNSAMVFSDRLYLLLPAFICHLRFYLSLKKLLHNMRGKFQVLSSVHKQCLEGLQCIDQLSICSSFDEVVKHNLFPSVGMILSMSQLVGHMTTTDQITNLAVPPPSTCRSSSIVLPRNPKVRKLRVQPIFQTLKN